MLFLLDSQGRSEGYDTLADLLKSYKESYRDILLFQISKIGRCLSQPKQALLESLLSSFGIRYERFCPAFITQALAELSPSLNYDDCDLNVFQLVSSLTGERYYGETSLIWKNDFAWHGVKSDIACLLRWIRFPNSDLADYTLLSDLFCFFSEQMQKVIIDQWNKSVGTIAKRSSAS